MGRILSNLFLLVLLFYSAIAQARTVKGAVTESYFLQVCK